MVVTLVKETHFKGEVMGNIDISQAMIIINTFAIIGAMIGFGKKVLTPVKKIYDMDIMIQEHEEKIDCLEKDIQELVKAQRMILLSQAKIVDHIISNNNIDELRKTREKILEMLD